MIDFVVAVMKISIKGHGKTPSRMFLGDATLMDVYAGKKGLGFFNAIIVKDFGNGLALDVEYLKGLGDTVFVGSLGCLFYDSQSMSDSSSYENECNINNSLTT